MSNCLSSIGLGGFSEWLTQKTALLLGHTLTVGSHRLVPLAQLGEGGFSVVLLCVDESGQRFALKRSIVQEPEQLETAKKEAALLRKLQHPNIIRFSGSEVAQRLQGGSEVYVLMELCEISTLKLMQTKSAQNSRFSEQDIARMLHDLAAAVAFLHSQDPPIAHRDIKADNLLRASDGKFKLCDFGSCITHAYEPASTREINILQEEIEKHTTINYRAPEMCDLFARTRIDQKVDVWALGCVLFYLCYFDLPFGESKLQILNGKWTFPAAECSEDFKEIIRHCLDQDTTSRWDVWEVLGHLTCFPACPEAPPRPEPSPVQPVYHVPGAN